MNVIVISTHIDKQGVYCDDKFGPYVMINLSTIANYKIVR